ncbi:sushi, von Willebrand factor type A, EGF and pentraxin domain-containing protein 1-like [Xenia sp. Carnegie-2017]|uniref:sushi, von Willebrand factor type A, EGF and pentraxin domain-containing protein 1-like n=1 Tax=Xenia sp. Carnegie-2017 TaxID=2897299 RepID=UPI001F03FDA6|nr:sushi, von Willebrand factor type A, EGF and pentraxin domain-containing protein 1-like [Xenia sp. Carnegie-2017]
MNGTLQLLLCFAGLFVLVINAKRRDCSRPKLPSSLFIYRLSKGAKKSQNRYKHGDWVFLRCKNNGLMIGPSLRMCKSGTWIGKETKCIVKRKTHVVRCRRIRYLKNGNIHGSRREVGAVLRFSCLNGYNLLGPKRLTCLSKGNWSGDFPRCLKDINCPNLTTPENGTRQGSIFKYGRRVLFTCNAGYHLRGSKLRKCMSNGKWSGEEATCVKMDTAMELAEIAENLRKNFVNKFNLVTVDSRARIGISSGASGLDFVFVLDSSASVGETNFKRGIEFVQTIIKEYGVSSKPQGTRVAIVTFNSVASIKFNLATNVITETSQAMKELGNIKFQGGGTNTEAALSEVFHGVAPEARERSHKVIFLITDGRSNTGTNPKHFAARLRERNYEIFAIGITKNADMDELKSIASLPYRSHIHLLANYETLDKLKDLISGVGNDSWACGLAGDINIRGNLKAPYHKTARDDAWPWQAAIYIDALYKCGGALVAEQWVLTSSNCFDKKMLKNLTGHTVKVVLGEHDRFDEAGTEQTYEAIKLFRAPKFAKGGRANLVLIKLNHPIKQTAYVRTVCYDEDKKSTLIWPTHYGVVTGWGSTTKGRNGTATIPASDELHQTVVRFVSERECYKKFSARKVRKNSFCGSSQQRIVDNCIGDTGGPVVVRLSDDKWILVGVIRINEGCTANSKYSLFTKVGKFSKWIGDIISNN